MSTAGLETTGGGLGPAETGVVETAELETVAPETVAPETAAGVFQAPASRRWDRWSPVRQWWARLSGNRSTGRFGDWLVAHRASLLLVLLLLVVVGAVNGINFDGWPGRVNDDEGTYTAQAFAIEKWGQLTHYTYWYDHPFGGWLMIAAYTWVTDAFDRTATAVTGAREFMVMLHLVSCALVYVLSRRLGMRRVFAASAVLLFSLSPLAVYYHRMVFLDNLAVVWVLAALVVAASPRRSVGSAFLAGAYLGAAFWCKETSLVLLPGVALLLWQNRDLRNWRFARRNFLCALVGVCGTWPLFALIKNELFEGPGHSSLVWAIKWQLFARTPSGSLLDPDSGTRGITSLWLGLDPLLVPAGVVAAVLLLLFVRRMRAMALLLVLQVLLMLRNGYMPYAYVTAMLPFAALCVAGLADAVAPGVWARRRAVLRATAPLGRPLKAYSEGAVSLPAQRRAGEKEAPAAEASASEASFASEVPFASEASFASGVSFPREIARLGVRSVDRRWVRRVVGSVRGLAIVAALGVAAATLPQEWAPTLREAVTVDASAPSREATAWLSEHVPPGEVIVTDDYLWTDLVLAGRDPIWFYKIDLDPEVMEQLPDGWRDIDYLVVGELRPETLQTLPTVAEAVENSVVVETFGDNEIFVRRVVKPD